MKRVLLTLIVLACCNPAFAQYRGYAGLSGYTRASGSRGGIYNQAAPSAAPYFSTHNGWNQHHGDGTTYGNPTVQQANVPARMPLFVGLEDKAEQAPADLIPVNPNPVPLTIRNPFCN